MDISVLTADRRLKDGRSVGVGQLLFTLWYQAVTGRLLVVGCAIIGTGS